MSPIKRLVCFSTLVVLVAASGAYAQIGTINSAVVTPRVFNDVPGATFTPVNNYPALISFSEQDVSQAAGFANRDLWQFSNTGGTSAYQFQNGNYFQASFDLMLTGSPIAPRKEAGFLFSTVNDGDIQFIVNTDGHEVVQFGGISFYSFNASNGITYNSGDTIHLGLTYFLDANGKNALQFFANGTSSPVFEFGTNVGSGALDIGDGSTLGAYFQISNDPNNPTNSGTALFQNISFIPLSPTNYDVFLPVYQVTQAGVTATQASSLASSLNIPASLVTLSNGLVSFIDPTNYVAVPTTPVTNATIVSNLVAQTANQYPAIPISVQAINFSALSNLTVLDGSSALNSASSALGSSQLSPQFGTPAIEHTTFTVFYTNDSNIVISNSLPLDTAVNYQFFDPNGYPLVGPGAQVQLNYGATGNVTRLLYAARQLTPGPASVQLMSASQASNRVASLFPPNAHINLQVVYFCPPFLPVPVCPACPPPPWNPTNIIPWYSCTGTIDETNPVSGTVSPLTLMTQLIPATDDPNFVPSANLSASAPQGTQVVASVVATGGTAPYSYLWSGSDPATSTNVGASIAYTPTIRVGKPPLIIILSGASVTVSWPYPSTGFILESTTNLVPSAWSQVTSPVQTNSDVNSVTVLHTGRAQFFRLRLASQTLAVTETVTVTVTDANGVSAQATQSVAAQGVPIEATQDPAIDWGCESPYDPGLGSNDRASWQTGMIGNPGAGSQRFCWTGRSSWPGDFIEPPTPGVLPARPWIYGDADFSNWGVNSANIVLYIGHGNPNAISFIIYNYGSCGYVNPISVLWEPYYQQIYNAAVKMPNTCAGAGINYSVPNFIGSWRNSGPTVNDNLYWLCLLSCEVLQDYDAASKGAWTRWGPAFNGVHILTGFHSLAGAGTGFPNRFAYDMLHVGGVYPLTIQKAWFDAAAARGTGTPAAMGPIHWYPPLFGVSWGVWDFNDHYWGKGFVGPTIPRSQINGWWYIKGTGPVTFH